MICLNKLCILLTFQSTIVSCYPGRVNQQKDVLYPAEARSTHNPSPPRSLQNVVRPFDRIFNQPIKTQEVQDQKIYFQIGDQGDDDIIVDTNVDRQNNGHENMEVREHSKNNGNANDGSIVSAKPLKTLSEIITRPVGHIIKLATNKQENQSERIYFNVNDENDNETTDHDKFNEQGYSYEINKIREKNHIRETKTGKNFNNKERNDLIVTNKNVKIKEETLNEIKLNDDIRKKNENNKNIIKGIEIDLNTIDKAPESTTESTTDFTTTEDYETTALDDLDNRAAVPGAVVASLLG